MTDNLKAISDIVSAVAKLSEEARRPLSTEDHYNYHEGLHGVFGLILHHDDFDEIDLGAVSKDLFEDGWDGEAALKNKSVNDLRAIIYQHLRTERFSRGHIQSLVATGYLDKWVDALKASDK